MVPRVHYQAIGVTASVSNPCPASCTDDGVERSGQTARGLDAFNFSFPPAVDVRFSVRHSDKSPTLKPLPQEVMQGGPSPDAPAWKHTRSSSVPTSQALAKAEILDIPEMGEICGFLVIFEITF
jgi:hypothetical protein